MCDRSIQALVRARASANPDALAVAAPDATLTYGELLRRATALAALLRRAGVGQEVPVGLCLPRSAALVVGALAILDAGGAYVAMDPDHPAERLRFILEDAGARVLVTSGSARVAPNGMVRIDVETESIRVERRGPG